MISRNWAINGYTDGFSRERRRPMKHNPAVKEALKFLEPHILPEWLIPQFRSHLNRDSELEVDKEGKQQVLRPTFEGVRKSVYDLVGKQMDALSLFSLSSFHSRCLSN
jgi:hypothetical protein